MIKHDGSLRKQSKDAQKIITTVPPSMTSEVTSGSANSTKDVGGLEMMYITKVMKHKEVALYSTTHILHIPGLTSKLFPNFDHDYCTKLFEDFTKLLSQKMEVVIWKDRCDLCVGDMFKLKALACSSCGKSFHLGCLGIRTETPVHVESFICNTCEIKNGQTSHYSKDHLGFVETTPKEDRQGFIDGFIGRSFSGPNDLPVKYFSGQKGDTLTVEYLDKNGFMVPIIVQSKEHLDMKVPVQLTLKFLKDRLGWLKQLDVVNVLGRKDGMMYLDEFQDYFETENSSLILCSLSLELSRTKLKSIFQAPKVVRSIDWGVQFPQSGDLKVYTDRYLQHCMKGGFIDFHVEGGGSSIWHHICRGRELIYLIKPNEDGSDELKKFAGWLALSQGTSFFEHHNPPLRCYRIEVAEGETIFIPGGFIRASYYPEKTVIIGGNFLNIYNVETQFKCFHMENDLCIKGQYRFPNFKGFHWQVARGFSKAPSLERIPRKKHNLTRLYNELENWANIEDENGASAGCSYASKDITTQSILMEFKDYIDHCNEDDDFELEGERASEIPGTTDKGVEPSGSGATGSGPSEPTAVPGIAASFQQTTPSAVLYPGHGQRFGNGEHDFGVDQANNLSDSDGDFPRIS